MLESAPFARKGRAAIELMKHNKLIFRSALLCIGILFGGWAGGARAVLAAPRDGILIGNYLRSAPNGIAWIVRDSAAIVVDPGGPSVMGAAAPDNSYHRYEADRSGAHVTFEWGRVNDTVVARLSSDRPISIDIALGSGWPGWTTAFTPAPDGVTALAQVKGADPVAWAMKTAPAPAASSPAAITVAAAPGAPVRFVAGIGALPDLSSVDGVLDRARASYAASRPHASGDWGDFVGAIADNVNNFRLYASDNHLLAHSVSRTWARTENGSPYFCWDSFLTANLASLEDPDVAQNTVRAILSYESAEGDVPNYCHWERPPCTTRSQPPVGSLCVWKMHERHPDDRDFLAEVYPKLALWHDWWMKHRSSRKDGLLEWGSDDGDFQGAQYETGWDDNLQYASAIMDGTTMNCYAVDLNAMWAMDARYLALIADFLGRPADARQYRSEAAAMEARLNAKLWDAKSGLYASRFFDDAYSIAPVPDSAMGGGYDAVVYDDPDLGRQVGTRHDARVDFNWRGKPPIDGMTAAIWSGRWKAAFTAPDDGLYRFSAITDDGVRVLLDGKTVIDGWSGGSMAERRCDVRLTKGQTVSVVVEYVRRRGLQLHFRIRRLVPAQGGFLTRITPMNFYPLMTAAPDAARAASVMSVLCDPARFWGKYLLPTAAYNDPDYRQQEYWRGDVWGPPNYLVWLGIKKYGTGQQIDEFAERNVALFMTQWLERGECCENYLSTTGKNGHDAHYTWGALLNLVGLESIVDVDDSGAIVLDGRQSHTINLSNIPLLGRSYDVHVTPGRAVLLQNGHIVSVAENKLVHYRPR